MPAIDAHCHLADPRIQAELPRILAEAREAGIGSFIQGGVDPADWRRQRELKERFPGRIITAYGLHPWWVSVHTRDEIEKGFGELEAMLGEADALGEAGLDFSKRFEPSTHAIQQWAFEKQLELRRSFPSKPLILHVVRAHEPALAALRVAGQPLCGLVHSFSASHDIARNYLDLGLDLSVSGVITRKGFETLRRAMRYIPGDRLMLETDSPDQAPEGWTKPWNEPSSLLRTAQAVGELRGESAQAVLEKSAENLRRIFGEAIAR